MLAFFVKLMCYLVCLIPVRLVGAMGAGIGRTVYFLNKRHRNIALRNLKRVYPHKNDAWLKATALASFAELGRTTFETPHVFLRSKEFLKSRIEIEGEEEMRQAFDAGHGVIFVGFHYSNWELTAQVPALYGYPCSQIYRPLRQQALEDMLRGWRERFGNTLHSRDESIRWIPRAIKQGKMLALMALRGFRRLARSRPLRFYAQLSVVIVFALILVAGLFGDQNPSLNVAPLLTWTIWWCGLVVVILFAGKAWCYVCPWDAIATWMERQRLWRKTDTGLGLALPWPRALRNVWVATVLFVGLTWVELGFGVTMKPRATAYLGLGMLVLAIACAFLFERKSFCRYGCLVGRVSGLYAMFSGIEVRRRDAELCRGCAGRECVTGSETAYACPTFENPSRMAVNTYCIQCTECLQACPHDNLAVNLRPWGADLAVEGTPSADEAYLALLMLAITGFHGLTMTPAWPALLQWFEISVGMGPVLAFTAGMTALMGLPLVLYAVLIRISHAVAVGSAVDGGRPVSYRDYFIRYAYCVLPIALFYHLAHNLEHLLMEGPKVLRLVSDPLGRGWNLFGTTAWSIPPLASLDTLWILQVLLVGVGHVYSLWAAQKISRRTFADPKAATRSQLPILVGMIAFSVFSLWLLKQPMEMRTSAM